MLVSGALCSSPVLGIPSPLPQSRRPRAPYNRPRLFLCFFLPHLEALEGWVNSGRLELANGHLQLATSSRSHCGCWILLLWVTLGWDPSLLSAQRPFGPLQSHSAAQCPGGPTLSLLLAVAHALLFLAVSHPGLGLQA